MKRREIIRTVETLLILLTLAIGFYPVVSNAWNQFSAFRMISQYQGRMQRKMEENSGRRREELPDVVFTDEEGLLGYIEIPSISVVLPVYEGTSDKTLEKGVGHLESSSQPVGGIGTHTVLTGHRGLPSAELFTDLDQMRRGDTFTIHSSGRHLTYEVVEIRTVLPHETESLSIEEGEDLATLVTCTPYGVNTHRLLVTGRRLPAPDGMEYEDWEPYSLISGHESEWIREKSRMKTMLILAAAFGTAAAFSIRIFWIWFIDWPRERRRQRARKRQRMYRKMYEDEVQWPLMTEESQEDNRENRCNEN